MRVPRRRPCSRQRHHDCGSAWPRSLDAHRGAPICQYERLLRHARAGWRPCHPAQRRKAHLVHRNARQGRGKSHYATERQVRTHHQHGPDRMANPNSRTPSCVWRRRRWNGHGNKCPQVEASRQGSGASRRSDVGSAREAGMAVTDTQGDGAATTGGGSSGSRAEGTIGAYASQGAPVAESHLQSPPTSFHGLLTTKSMKAGNKSSLP